MSNIADPSTTDITAAFPAPSWSITMTSPDHAAASTPRRRLAPTGSSDSDAGFTLPELLITVMIMGILVSVMSMAMTVMFRTTPQAELRLAESKDITFLQTWVPVDLSSAINSYDDPADADVLAKMAAQDPPMTYLADLPGTNVLTLVVPDLTTGEYKIISYRYLQVDGEWQLARYRITNPGVGGTGLDAERVSPVGVAHEVPPPPEDGSWVESETNPQRPIHAFEITSRNQVVLRPIGENVTVKFKSGNTFSTGGAGLSAEKDLTPNDPVTLPDPTAPPTRCGGRIALVLDTSWSVPSKFQGGGDLEDAAIGFIDSFQGTPTDVTVIGFDSLAYQFYPNTGGAIGQYFSLLNPSSDVTSAKAAIDSLPNKDVAGQSGSFYYGSQNLTIGWTQKRYSETGQLAFVQSGSFQDTGGTNWEDALHAPFYDIDANQRPTTPETVIFITDGQPNRRRSDFIGTSKTQPANEATNVQAAAVAANRGRATGARIIGILLNGTATDEQNLAAVVGGNKWNGSVNSDGSINVGNAVAADYFASDFPSLGAVLRSIMAAQCGGTVTVQKEINGGTASGLWNYSTDTGGATLDLSLASSITFDYIFGTNVTEREIVITEEVKSGFVFDRAVCSNQGVPITDPSKIRPNDDGSPGVTLNIQPDQAVSCTMYSDPE